MFRPERHARSCVLKYAFYAYYISIKSTDESGGEGRSDFLGGDRYIAALSLLCSTVRQRFSGDTSWKKGYERIKGRGPNSSFIARRVLKTLHSMSL